VPALEVKLGDREAPRQLASPCNRAQGFCGTQGVGGRSRLQTEDSPCPIA
jgi:hypothetical protein